MRRLAGRYYTGTVYGLQGCTGQETWLQAKGAVVMQEKASSASRRGLICGDPLAVRRCEQEGDKMRLRGVSVRLSLKPSIVVYTSRSLHNIENWGSPIYFLHVFVKVGD